MDLLENTFAGASQTLGGRPGPACKNIKGPISASFVTWSAQNSLAGIVGASVPPVKPMVLGWCAQICQTWVVWEFVGFSIQAQGNRRYFRLNDESTSNMKNCYFLAMGTGYDFNCCCVLGTIIALKDQVNQAGKYVPAEDQPLSSPTRKKDSKYGTQ